MSKVRLVPAILTNEPEALERMVRQVETFTTHVQFDIMDGEFVPSRSVTWEHLAALSTALTWEAHLMVREPQRYLEDFVRLGAKKIVFHYEATGAPGEVISLVRKLGRQTGLAVNPDTPISTIAPLVGEVDSILFMSVQPGYYGSPFIPEVLDKIKKFRSSYPDMEIGIDGGAKESNITQIARSGVDVIYVGSAILLQPNPGKSYQHLLSLINEDITHTHRQGKNQPPGGW